MKAKLTLSLLNSLETTGTTYEVHDTTVTGLFVRVTASGHKAYVVTWGRAKKRTLGRVGVLTLDQARKEALQTARDEASTALASARAGRVSERSKAEPEEIEIDASKPISQQQGLIRQDRRRHQLDRRVLGPADRNRAVKAVAAVNDDAVHGCRGSPGRPGPLRPGEPVI